MTRDFVCERRGIVTAVVYDCGLLLIEIELLTVACCLRFVALLVVCFIATRESFEGEWHRSK